MWFVAQNPHPRPHRALARTCPMIPKRRGLGARAPKRCVIGLWGFRGYGFGIKGLAFRFGAAPYI